MADVSNSFEEQSAGSDKEQQNESDQSNTDTSSQDTQVSSEETSDSSNESETTAEPEWRKIKIKIYFADEQAQFLIGEERELTGKYTEDFIIAVFNELLEGPVSSNLYNLIPEGTAILSSEYLDGYAYLNLSREFVDNRVGNSLVDFLVINSIASSMIEIEGIEGVVFKVDSEKIDIYGEIDIKNPATRNESIIKK
jgi:spore germination protein GerM